MEEEYNKMKELVNNFYKKIDNFFFKEYIEHNIIIKACDDPECKCIEMWENATTEERLKQWYLNLESLDIKLWYITRYTDWNNHTKDILIENNSELEEKLEHYEEIPPAYNSDDCSLSSE